jgi:hypothetical protein
MVKFSLLQQGWMRVEEPSKLLEVLRAVCVDVLLVRGEFHLEDAGGRVCS